MKALILLAAAATLTAVPVHAKTVIREPLQIESGIKSALHTKPGAAPLANRTKFKSKGRVGNNSSGTVGFEYTKTTQNVTAPGSSSEQVIINFAPPFIHKK